MLVEDVKEKFQLEIEDFDKKNYDYEITDGEGETFVYTFEFHGEFIKKNLNMRFTQKNAVKDIYGIYVEPFNASLKLDSVIIPNHSDEILTTCMFYAITTILLFMFAAVIGLLCGNSLENIWNIIDLLQFYSFMLYRNINLPLNVKQYFSLFSH